MYLTEATDMFLMWFCCASIVHVIRIPIFCLEVRCTVMNAGFQLELNKIVIEPTETYNYNSSHFCIKMKPTNTHVKVRDSSLSRV